MTNLAVTASLFGLINKKNIYCSVYEYENFSDIRCKIMIIYKCTKGIKRLIEKRKAFYNPDTQDHQPGMFTCDHECHDVFGYIKTQDYP